MDTIVKFKPNVSMKYVHPKIGHAIDIARHVWELKNISECVVTSMNDSTHSPTSLHYAGCAVDFRIWNVPELERDQIVVMLKSRLRDEYDIINEGDHYHVEWQPKRKDD